MPLASSARAASQGGAAGHLQTDAGQAVGQLRPDWPTIAGRDTVVPSNSRLRTPGALSSSPQLMSGQARRLLSRHKLRILGKEALRRLLKSVAGRSAK